MRATAVVEVRAAGNRSRYQTLRSDPPLLLRPTPAGLYLVVSNKTVVAAGVAGDVEGREGAARIGRGGRRVIATAVTAAKGADAGAAWVQEARDRWLAASA